MIHMHSTVQVYKYSKSGVFVVREGESWTTLENIYTVVL
jgi:hypothetical protein